MAGRIIHADYTKHLFPGHDGHGGEGEDTQRLEHIVQALAAWVVQLIIDKNRCPLKYTDDRGRSGFGIQRGALGDKLWGDANAVARSPY